jgi:nucleoside-diphosphate-sugar epimerase
MRVCVTGGGGFVGRRLLRRLREQGHEITVLSRSERAGFPEGVRVFKGDLTSAQCPVLELLEGCRAVFHCAGEVRDEQAMRALHVEGTRRLVDGALQECQRSGAPMHWVQLSSVGAYGPPPGAVDVERTVTEATATRPVGEYEVTKTLADELVKRAGERPGLTWTLVRPSNIFAADMPNNSLRALGAMVRKGLFFYIGRPGAVATYVHVDDVVDVLLRCGTDERAQGQVFNLSNDCLLEEMMNGMAAALGVKPPSVRLPAGPVRLAAGVAVRLVRFPLTPERINALIIRTRYPYSKLERELGLTPRRSVPEAIGEVVRTRSAESGA